MSTDKRTGTIKAIGGSWANGVKEILKDREFDINRNEGTLNIYDGERSH